MMNLMVDRQTQNASDRAEDLRQDIEKFLQAGKAITPVDPGASGENDKEWSWNASRYPEKRKK